jgi:glycerate-2-kinase
VPGGGSVTSTPRGPGGVGVAVGSATLDVGLAWVEIGVVMVGVVTDGVDGGGLAAGGVVQPDMPSTLTTADVIAAARIARRCVGPAVAPTTAFCTCVV